MDEFLRRQPVIVPPPSFSNKSSARHPHKVLGWALIIMFIILAVLAVQYIYFRPINKSAVVKADNSIGNTIAGFDSVLRVDPSNVSALVAKATVLALQAKTESKPEYAAQAATLAEKAVTIDPKNSEAYRALGYANELQQKYVEAHTAYQQAISLSPLNSVALLSDAHLYDLEGDLAKASTAYTAILAKQPALYAARLGLAHVESLSDKTDAAQKDYKTVYTDSKDARERAEAAYGLGTVSLSQNKYDAAYQYMSDATTTDSKYASGWLGLGMVEYVRTTANKSGSADTRQSGLMDAVRSLNVAIKLNPSLALAHFQLAIVTRSLGQKSLALAILATAANVVQKDNTLNSDEKEAVANQIKDSAASIQRHN